MQLSSLLGLRCPHASFCRETEPNWGEEIAADVKDECSKYGQVLFVHVDTESKVRGRVVVFVHCFGVCCSIHAFSRCTSTKYS